MPPTLSKTQKILLLERLVKELREELERGQTHDWQFGGKIKMPAYVGPQSSSTHGSLHFVIHLA